MVHSEFFNEFNRIKDDIESALNKLHQNHKGNKNKKLTIYHQHNVEHKHEVRHKVELTVISALIASLAFLIALSWKDTLSQAADFLFLKFLPFEDHISIKIFESIFITIAAICVVYYLTKLQQRRNRM